MCGRYTLYSPVGDISALLGAALSEHELSIYRESRGYNIAPSQTAPICILHEGRRAIVPARWGFRPRWARESGPTPINAKAETVLQKPFYRDAIRRGRCLVPSSGWYEWQPVSRDRKQPFYIRPAAAQVFAFAGIYDNSAEEPGRRFAIMIGNAAEGLRPIHARQPIVVRPEDYDAWLSPSTPHEELERILNYRPADFEQVPISKRVGNPRNDDPDLLHPIE